MMVMSSYEHEQNNSSAEETRWCEQPPEIDIKKFFDKIIWKTLKEKNRWQLQKNRITGQACIVDPFGDSVLWGNVELLTIAFDAIAEHENIRNN